MITAPDVIRVVNRGRATQQCGGKMLYPGVPQHVDMAFLNGFYHVRDLEFDFTGLEELLQSRTSDGRPVLDWWCPMSRVDGYGRHALDIYRGLVELGADVRLRDVGWVERIYLEPELGQLADTNRTRLPAKVAVAMTLPYDPKLNQSDSIIQIGLTQFETDRIPIKHVAEINKCHHLIVTSAFQPEIMKRCGVRIPISVMAPGVDTEFFTVRPKREDDEFRVLILGALTGRKDPLGAISIFQAAAGGSPEWRLTIKTRVADGIDDVQEIAKRDERITVIVGDTHPAQILNFYHYHDCLLWPSRGEGVGLPPLEAMSCGLEVVCAANSGMLDYLSDEIAWPVETERMEPAGWPLNKHGFSRDYVEQFGEVGSWWCPSWDHAVAQLQAAHQAWRQGNGKGVLAAQRIRERHTLKHQAQSVLSTVEIYLN